MVQTDPGAACAARQGPPREQSRVRQFVITVLVVAATLGTVVFVALVIVPRAGAAGGCGGG